MTPLLVLLTNNKLSKTIKTGIANSNPGCAGLKKEILRGDYLR
jgi:hypothetical protein